LKWEVVNGTQPRAEGHPAADAGTEYIKVHLARPVPLNGQVRLLIDKTHKDAKSYWIAWRRSVNMVSPPRPLRAQ